MIPLPQWRPCPAPPIPRRQLQQVLQQRRFDEVSAAPTSPLLARAGATATAVGRFIYFIGGRTGDDFHSDVLRFDTSSLEWARGFDPCPSPRSHHVAFYVEGSRGAPGTGAIWVAGGHDAERVLASVLAFDPAAQRWSDVTPRLRGQPGLLTRMAAAVATAPAAAMTGEAAATAAASSLGGAERGSVVVHGGVAPLAAASGESGAGPSGSTAADTWLSDLVLIDPKRMLVERIEVAGANGASGNGSRGVGQNAEAGGEKANGDGGNEESTPSPSLPYLPPPRAYHSLTCVSGRLVVFGGRLQDNSLAKGKDLGCLFDPVRREWSSLNDAPGPPTTPLPPRPAPVLAVPPAVPPARPRASHRAVCVGDRVLICGGVGQEDKEGEEGGGEVNAAARAADGTTPARKETPPPLPPPRRQQRTKAGGRLLLNDVVSLVVAPDGACSWSRDDDPRFIAAAVARAGRSAVAAAPAATGAMTATRKRKEAQAAAEKQIAAPPLLRHHHPPPPPLCPLQRAAHAMVLVHGALLFVAGGYGERDRGGTWRGAGVGFGATTAAATTAALPALSSSYPSDMWRLGPLPSTAALARSSLRAAEEQARKRSREVEKARREQERKEAAVAGNGQWKTTKRGRSAQQPPKFAQQPQQRNQSNALPFVNTAAESQTESPGHHNSATGAHSPEAAHTVTPAREQWEPRPRRQQLDLQQLRQARHFQNQVPPSSSALLAALRDKDLALERAEAAEKRAREAAARAAAEAAARRDSERSAFEREKALSSFKELERVLQEASAAMQQAERAAETERQQRLLVESKAASDAAGAQQQLATTVEKAEVAAAAAATAARQAVDEAKRGRAEALARARSSESARAALQQELAAERQRSSADVAEAARRLSAAERERDRALEEARLAREAEGRNAAAARGHVAKLEEAEDALRAKERAVVALSAENRKLSVKLGAAADAAAAAARDWSALVRTHGPTFGALAHLDRGFAFQRD